jgi:hypothetical protein
MKNTFLKIFGVIMALGFVSSLIVNPVQAASDARRGGPGGQNQSSGMTNQRENGDTTGLGFVETEPLTAAEVESLQAAIMEEYMAYNTYTDIIDTYGQVVPFSRIVTAEQKHTEALLRLADYYSVEVPENNGQTFDYAYTTLAEACQAGVEIEKADGADLQQLIAETENPNLIKLYTNLMNASLNKHLVAFEACN